MMMTGLRNVWTGRRTSMSVFGEGASGSPGREVGEGEGEGGEEGGSGRMRRGTEEGGGC